MRFDLFRSATLSIAFAAVLLVGLAALFPAGAAAILEHEPAPELGPDEVVRIQLEALRANDASDRGIATCFRFASPSNKQVTGPLQRFATMIKQGAYALMLAYANIDYEPIEVVEDRARQRVHLTGGGIVGTYVLYLSRQQHKACKGCWMTNSVGVEAISQST